MSKQIFPFSFILGLVFICSFIGHAQNLDSLVSIQRQADAQEKIYVHFDKNYYNPGETLWFKAYIFSGIEPSLTSKNFYAELLDENGMILDRKTAPIFLSGAASSFDLAATLNKSTLYFRAYTIAMLNGDTSFLYTKPIHIILPTMAVKLQPQVAKPTAITFLPEGGDWVNNLATTMAFKVTDGNGFPVSASGVVKSNDGTKVADLLTLHNGMGSFKILPEQGKTYMATWKDEKGKTYTTALPATKTLGVVLQVADNADGKRFVIERSEDAGDDNKYLHIVAYMNQHVAYMANVNLVNKTSTTSIIPTKELPTGILQITLFDKNYKPLAERITFVNNHDYEFDADTWIPGKNTTKRGLNNGEIMLSDTVPANLSISVTDADLNDGETYQDNIISHLLLTSDLRGKVINPYYYFFSTDDSAAYKLDLVMLTNGWRRYNWNNVLAAKTPTPVWKESNYLSLDGSVSGSSAGGFAPNTQLNGILRFADSTTSILSLPVSRKGKIFTDGMIFYDYAKLYFQFSDRKTHFDKSMLTVDNGLRKGYKMAKLDSNSKIETITVDADMAIRNTKNNINQLRIAGQREQKSHELQNVTVIGKSKTPLQKLDEKYASGMFSGDALQFDLVNDPFAASSMSLFQYLQGKVAGLQISNATGGGTPTLSWRGGTPALYLNEMQSDVDMIGNTPMTDIAYIKIFRPGEAGVVSGGGGGVISVYTKKGGDVNTSDSKGLDFVQMAGYSALKEFYSPDYASGSPMNDLDDYRSTLYWNPFVILNKHKKRIKYQFYNSDVTRRFRIVLEGINSDGKLFHVEKEIQ